MPSIAHIIRRRRNRKQYRAATRTRSRLWLGLVIAVVALAMLVPLSIILGLAGWLYGRAAAQMPTQAETIYLDPIIGPTNFYDRTGAELLYAVVDPLGDEREWIALDDLPPHVIAATLRQEDPDYLQAGGFDFGQTLTRLWRYILGTNNRRDTSIAGRLASNTLLPPARNSGLDEDVLWITLTAEVQRRFSPDDVLAWYLNTAFYGNDAYGIDAAAQVYFGKRAVELTLDEAALLAAIPLAPQFNPFDDEIAARQRQMDLLRLMLSAGDITQEQFDVAAAANTPLNTDLTAAPRIATEFSLYAREQTENLLDTLGLDGSRLVSRGGLQVTTSLDLDIYDQADCTLRAHLEQLRGGDPGAITTRTGAGCAGAAYLESPVGVDASSLPDTGSLLLLDVQTGEIRALVGDALAYDDQPGVVLHPIIYLTGFLNGHYTPASMLMDIPQPFPGPVEGLIYTPVNPDGTYRGPINLRDAMVSGLRAPAAFVAEREGFAEIFSVGYQMGFNRITSEGNVDLSLIERGGQVSLLDVGYVYSVFASMGTMQGVETNPPGSRRALNPVAILRIEDAEGNVLWEYDSDATASRRPLLSGEIAYLVNDILADGETRRSVLGLDDTVLQLDRPAALINGLTGDSSESWTVGYTPQLVGAAHLSRGDEEALSLDAAGLQGAAPVWQALMQYTHARYGLAPATWSQPEGIVEYAVCERSGLLPGEDSPCPRRNELFLEQMPVPPEDTYWTSVAVNQQTGLLATSDTPNYLRREQVYFLPPLIAEEWWVSNNLPLPPQEYDTLGVPEALSSVQIFLPQNFSYVGGVVDIRGTMDVERLESYQLRYGQGVLPENWFGIGGVQTSFEPGTSLGNWDTTGLADDFYTLELSVRFIDGTPETAFVQVTVDNTPPEVTLLTGTNGDEVLYRWPAQSRIPIVADVSDNYRVVRVEFYHNGALIGTDEEWPYSFDYEITGAGDETFRAVAFDDVGNQASDEVQVEVIRE